VLVSLDKFAVFIPWSEVTVSGERSMPGTLVRLQTAAVPSMNLEFHLDDEAVDTLFAGVLAPLPRRSPPGRLYWPKPWAVLFLVAVMLVAAVVLAVLKLRWPLSFAAATVVCVVIVMVWHACRPILEEDRKQTASASKRRL
jgi:hypothetical protein